MSHMNPETAGNAVAFLCQDFSISGPGMANSVMVGVGWEAMPYLKGLLRYLPALKKRACNTRESRRLDPKTVTSWLCMFVNLSDAQFPLKKKTINPLPTWLLVAECT